MRASGGWSEHRAWESPTEKEERLPLGILFLLPRFFHLSYVCWARWAHLPLSSPLLSSPFSLDTVAFAFPRSALKDGSVRVRSRWDQLVDWSR